jgi:hypothetical protein
MAASQYKNIWITLKAGEKSFSSQTFFYLTDVFSFSKAVMFFIESALSL